MFKIEYGEGNEDSAQLWLDYNQISLYLNYYSGKANGATTELFFESNGDSYPRDLDKSLNIKRKYYV